MARQGVSRPKVVSSGRLTGSGRGQIHKRKVTGRSVPPLEPAYSLYSTDSEDQVMTIHEGLDRCAALLNGILQAEQAESKPKPQGTKTIFKPKPKNLSRKIETDKKKHGKKANTAMHLNKIKMKPGPVQKTILSTSSHTGLAGQPCCRSDQNPGIRWAQGSHDQPAGLTPVTQAPQHSVPQACPQPAASCNLPSSGQVQTSTVFNCRLTTSTPALSPQRPGPSNSEPIIQQKSNCQIKSCTTEHHRCECTSECLQSNGSSSGEFHCITQSWPMNAATPFLPQGSVAKTVTQTPVTASPVQNGPSARVEQGVPLITSPICGVPQWGSVGPNISLASSSGFLSCPSTAGLATQVPIQAHISHPQPDPNGPVPNHYNAHEQEISLEESGGSTSAEEKDEEQDGVDTTPVRDISCQTSKEKLTDVSLEGKPTSPEKTARKVMTLKFMLGELKTLVANQDSEAVRLISEVEQNISLLPVMVGSTNIQAEIALALQPLRSENVQLRRRLRILNQQLLERERAERRARPVDCNMEVVALQSLNLTLQTQLNESRGELETLQQENMRLQKAVEDIESYLQQHKELCKLENHRLRLEVNDALTEMQSCKNKLQECEIEKSSLTLSLQQREAEISRLQEVIRNLQRNQRKYITEHSPQLDLCQPNSHSQLTKSVLELHENAQRETAVLDQLSDSVKTYLQTLEGTGQASPPQRVHVRSQTLQPASPVQSDVGKESIILSNTKVCSPKVRGIHEPTLEAIGENVHQLQQKRTIFAPLREAPMVQLATGVAQSKPHTQCDELITAKSQRENLDGPVGLKYLGHAFTEKLGISDVLHTQSRDFLSDPDGAALQLNQKNKSLDDHTMQSQHARQCLRMGIESAYTGRPSVMEKTYSSCDIKSLASDWSLNSWSTFNTRDEQNFRDGLAALDASIASLQRTLKADLNK
ncbi:coiled-coil domain-containing protein 14-like isoform X2 [Myxocyprinus asiaticus]|uniref:coiled-coil domain-containing protein 14-like isoform X2 n=1 Tax=Myxocyprinus asiaticus TaxID=70543 RepID=UPI0022230C86|nr:coiled-coil domain-containing protein 14-like isoform X2 [Myxocyprinus asiaticus]XP_051568337.1 coiled-coil domain-containing protein 14-like isoform X2 [Myxocyprinus asiaticus]